MRHAVDRVVVLEVAAALARLEPGRAGAAVGVLPAGQRQQGFRHRRPVHALFRADHAPAVAAEPVGRRAGHGRADRVVVDAEVVPVDQEVEVVERQAPGRVQRLEHAAGGQPALALQEEDLDAGRARALERQRLARGGRAAVARRPGVELQEEGLARHLGVARQPAAAPEAQQILPEQGAFGSAGDRVAAVAGLRMLDPQRLVEHGQGAVDQRDRVPRAQHEAVAEALLRVADVPPHRTAEQGRDQDMHLRPRPARMPALAIVQDDVQKLVDQVLGFFPVGELGGEIL